MQLELELHAAVRSLVDEVESMSLVECRELHEKKDFETHHVEELFNLSEDADAVLKKDINNIMCALERCTDRAPQIAELAHSGGRLRSSGPPLDLELHHTGGLQALDPS